MISLPEIISCSSSLCILFCTLLISACTFHLFLPSPKDLLFSPASPLNFFTILTPKICQKFSHTDLCHLRFANSSQEWENWSNPKHGCGKESLCFRFPHCTSKKKNDLLPHSDRKIQPGYKKQQQAEWFWNVPLPRQHQSVYCPIFLLPSTPSELLTYTHLPIH